MPKRPYAVLAAEALHQSVADLSDREAAEVVKRFVELLREKNRLSLLPNVLKAYERLASGTDAVKVTTAEPLSGAAAKALSEALKKLMNGKGEVAFAADPSLLGGAVIRHGDTLLDASVKRRLELLKLAMIA